MLILQDELMVTAMYDGTLRDKSLIVCLYWYCESDDLMVTAMYDGTLLDKSLIVYLCWYCESDDLMVTAMYDGTLLDIMRLIVYLRCCCLTDDVIVTAPYLVGGWLCMYAAAVRLMIWYWQQYVMSAQLIRRRNQAAYLLLNLYILCYCFSRDSMLKTHVYILVYAVVSYIVDDRNRFLQSCWQGCIYRALLQRGS